MDRIESEFTELYPIVTWQIRLVYLVNGSTDQDFLNELS